MRFIAIRTMSLLALAGPMLVASEPTQTIPLSTIRGISLTGEICRPGQNEGVQAVGLVFLSSECPISNQFIPELNRIHAQTKSAAVEFYGVISDRTVTRRAAADFAKEYGIEFPVLFDASGTLALECQPTHVPEAFVLDPIGNVRYRGRINDQFTEDLRRRQNVQSHDLLDALTAIANGSSPTEPRTTPVGCKLSPRMFEVPKDAVSFNREIAPILYAQCTECHRSGEVAPFELLAYADAAKRADFLAEIVKTRRMPPWKAEPNVGHFLGERILHDREIELIQQWADAGAPEGPVEDLPAIPSFTEGWQLGEPDLVVQMAEPYELPASGPDQNRFFVIPIDIPEDKYVVGVEFRAGNPRIVHHAVLYLDRSGYARKRDAETPEPGFEGFIAAGIRDGVLGFWAPGYTPRFYPKGVGQKLLTKTDLAMQLHYHPSGKEESDQSMVGIHFADRPIEKKVGGLALINFDVDIPAGESQHEMAYSFTTPVGLELIDVTPHMHMVGTKMTLKATTPDGTEIPLIQSNWDFNWQDVYRFRDIVRIPAGTRFDLRAIFDNSDANPSNPNSPPRRIAFGEETSDEMCICACRTLVDISAGEQHELREALRESMQAQMKNPRVLLNVTRFMMSGQGKSAAPKPDAGG